MTTISVDNILSSKCWMFSSVVDDVITVGGFARIWQRIYISRRPFGISAASTIQLTWAKQTFDYVHFLPNER
jgi:hypothetical protein